MNQTTASTPCRKRGMAKPRMPVLNRWCSDDLTRRREATKRARAAGRPPRGWQHRPAEAGAAAPLPAVSRRGSLSRRSLSSTIGELLAHVHPRRPVARHVHLERRDDLVAPPVSVAGAARAGQMAERPQFCQVAGHRRGREQQATAAAEADQRMHQVRHRRAERVRLVAHEEVDLATLSALKKRPARDAAAKLSCDVTSQ